MLLAWLLPVCYVSLIMFLCCAPCLQSMTITANPLSLVPFDHRVIQPIAMDVAGRHSDGIFTLLHSHILFEASNPIFNDKIRLSITQQPQLGAVECRNSTDGVYEAVTTMLIDAIKAGRCRYRLTDVNTYEVADLFAVDASLGRLGFTQAQIDVSITPRPNISVTVEDVYIVFGSSKPLTEEHMKIQVPASVSDTDVIIFVTDLRVPSHFNLTVSGRRVTNFTLLSLRASLVMCSVDSGAYHRLQQELYFEFYVTNSFRDTVRQRIRVLPYFRRIRLVNPGLVVEEGQRVRVDKNLTAIAPPPQHTVVFTITQPPKTGQLMMDGEGIEQFTAADLNRGNVLYVHDSSEVFSDQFGFTARLRSSGNLVGIGDYSDNLNGTVHITVIPVNDLMPKVIRQLSQWKIVQYGRMRLDRDTLEYGDGDSDYNSSKLMYSKQAGLLHGYLTHSSAISKHLVNFTQHDINIGNVIYVHNSSDNTDDSLNFIVSDGVHKAMSNIMISVEKLIVNTSITSEKIRTPEGGSLPLTAHYGECGEETMCITSNLATIDLHKVSFRVAKQPQHGRLTRGDSTEILNVILLSELQNGDVRYIHDHSDEARDTLSLRPVYREVTFDPVDIVIDILLFDDTQPAVVNNTHIIVDEAMSVGLTTSILNASDTEVPASGLVYTVTRRPSHGRLLLNQETTMSFTQDDINNGRVQYEHDRGQRLHDHLILSLTDNHTDPIAVRVGVTVIPSVIPLEARPFSVDEGGMFTITPDSLSVANRYLNRQPLVIKLLQAPTHGHLLFAGLTEDRFETGQSSPLSDIYSSPLKYRHDDSDTLMDNFEVLCTWRDLSSQMVRVNISINAINDEKPVRVAKVTSIDVWFSLPYTLLPSELQFSDKDTPASELTYTTVFTDTPGAGVHVNGGPAVASFTQQQVNDGRVTVVVPGKGMQESLNVAIFTVSDGIHTQNAHIVFKNRPLYLVIEENTGLMVAADDKVTLTILNLSVTTNSPEVKFRLQYHSNSTMATLQHGAMMVGGVKTNTFSHDDLVNGLVEYQHTDTESWAPFDQVELFVQAVDAPFLMNISSLLVNVTIMHPTANNSALAANSPLEVLENGYANINGTHLQAGNIGALSAHRNGFPYDQVMVFFTPLRKSPRHGQLRLGEDINNSYPIDEFTQVHIDSGLVWYVHDHTESTEDVIEMNVTTRSMVDGSVLTLHTEMLEISILPVNDNPVNVSQFSAELTVIQALLHPMTDNDFHLHDPDSLQEAIVITVQINDTVNSPFIVDGLPSTEFRKEDIDEGAVSFQASDTTGSSEYQLEISDGRHSIAVTLAVETVPQALEVSKLVPVPIMQGDKSVALAQDYLLIATDSNVEDVIFNISRSPAYGTLRIEGEQAAITTFTLEEITAKSVIYHQEDMSQSRDSLEVVVSNRFQQLPPITVEVIVKPLVQMAPSLQYSYHDKFIPVKEMMDLSELEAVSGGVAKASITQIPSYGAVLWHSSRQRRALESSIESFSSKDLAEDRVVYVKDESAPPNTYEDGFAIRLTAPGVQPADAVVKFTLDTNIPARTVPTAISTSEVPNVKEENDILSQVIIPSAIGGFLLLVIVIVLVVLALRSQRRRDYKVGQSSLRNNTTNVDVLRHGQSPSLVAHSLPSLGHRPQSRVTISEMATPTPPPPPFPEESYGGSPPPPVAPKPGGKVMAMGSSVGDRDYMQISTTSTFAPRPSSSQSRDRSHTLPRNFNVDQMPHTYLAGNADLVGRRSNSDKVGEYVPSNLPIWPICKLAGQSAIGRLASRFANGDDQSENLFEVPFSKF